MVWMSLIMQLDEAFGVEVDIEELIENKTFVKYAPM